jgi:predicted RNA-binding protein with PIN domain
MSQVPRYLIDGYNLAHASGDLRGKAGPHGLERARNALAARLARGHGEQAGDVTIVFDAKHSPGDTPTEEIVQGVCVTYAVGEEADDLIERVIRGESVPKRLVVISSDHRIKDAARRRGCGVMTAGEYLDWLDRQETFGHSRDPARPRPEKPETESPDDAAAWLDAFRDRNR